MPAAPCLLVSGKLGLTPGEVGLALVRGLCSMCTGATDLGRVLSAAVPPAFSGVQDPMGKEVEEGRPWG